MSVMGHSKVSAKTAQIMNEDYDYSFEQTHAYIVTDMETGSSLMWDTFQHASEFANELIRKYDNAQISITRTIAYIRIA